MLRFVDEDRELQFILAHELAHNIEGHINKMTNNSIIGTILDIAAAGAGIDTSGSFGAMGAQMYSQDFEREAEYVTEPEGAKSNFWLNAILLNDRTQRDEFLKYTNDNGVMTRPMWTPMHTLSMYSHCAKGDLSNAEEIESRLVNIPSSVN